MGRRGYPAEFRRRVLELVESGRSIKELADNLAVSQQTFYTWRKHARIDRVSMSSSDASADRTHSADRGGSLLASTPGSILDSAEAPCAARRDGSWRSVISSTSTSAWSGEPDAGDALETRRLRNDRVTQNDLIGSADAWGAETDSELGL